ncbi:MAG TPA: hypothetical protein PLF91_14905, partial [Mycolicibacterium fallax]|nr:hypothetical protein [Mycolicibacterium fallax]
LTGLAGVAAERIHRALRLPGGAEGVLRTLELHPLVNPAGYVDAEFGDGRMRVRRSAAHDDGAWITLCGPGHTEALQAIATAIDPHLAVEIDGTADDWTMTLGHRERPLRESGEVAVVKVSGGAAFVFAPRESLPLTVL